jgi:hypothetical protein
MEFSVFSSQTPEISFGSYLPAIHWSYLVLADFLIMVFHFLYEFIATPLTETPLLLLRNLVLPLWA